MIPRALSVLVALCIASFASAQRPIEWRGVGGAAPAAEARAMDDVLVEAAAGGGRRHLVLQFDRPLTRHAQDKLRAGGLRLLRYLGDDAYFAVLRGAELDMRRVASVRELASVSEVRPEWKLHPALAAPEPPHWSVVEQSPAGPATVAVYVVLHADVPVEEGAAIARERGARVVDVLESIGGLVLELPPDRIAELTRVDAVQWIEPPLPRLAEFNDSNRTLVQANLVQAAPYDLDGSGVGVLVYDGGEALAGHVDFGGRLTVRDASGVSDHSTHVSGTIGGDGSASGGTYTGMAPGVTIESYGFEYDGTGTFLYTNPGDFEADYGEAMNAFGADVANNSIGSNTEINGFMCNIQGDYGVMSSLIDAVVRGSLGAPFRIVWANGNERQGSGCDVEGFGDYYSTAPPATAKNHITVGALNSNDDGMTSFSSWGPTDDGRLKPDISAPGCESGGDGGVTSTSSAGGYNAKCGTSMASPTVTGLCALMLEDYRVQFGGPDPRNSTLKILLAHSATDRGNPGPDYQFGYGSVRVKDAIDFMRLGNFREDSLGLQGDVVRYTINVGGADPEVRLTLAWDDAPGTPNVFGALVNDLDLRVFDPLGTRMFPWTLDPANPSFSAVQTGPDHANNVEQVLVGGPLAGTWTIEVRGFDLPSGPQVYSLASSHALTVGPIVRIGIVGALPTLMAPGVPSTVTAEVSAVNDSVVAGSPTLHFRYNAGNFVELPMTFVGGDVYQVDLPPPVCGATPEFYFSAEGLVSGVVTNPPAAPATTFETAVQEVTTLFTDDFEADLGWTVVNEALTDGPWERGVPAGVGARNDPAVDFDGSGACFLTDNVDGNSDVDGGPTRLVSPAYDLSGAVDPSIGYARWFANNDFDVDVMEVEISADGGGAWTLVESVQNTQGWTTHSFRVLDFVTPSANIVMRFSVTDNPNDSVTEAALDDFRIEDTACAVRLADCNTNGVVDAGDIASGRSADVNTDGVPDECQRPLRPRQPIFDAGP